MSDMDFYIDVIPEAAHVSRDIHARLLMAAHYCQVKNENVAVAWPDWSVKSSEFGLIFRVFGGVQALSIYLGQISGLTQNNLVKVPVIKPVPQTTKRHYFYRDRTVDRGSSASARARLQRRAIARGEAPKTIEEKPRTGGEHTLFMVSNHRPSGLIPFHIQRGLGAECATSSGKEYGLCVSLPDF